MRQRFTHKGQWRWKPFEGTRDLWPTEGDGTGGSKNCSEHFYYITSSQLYASLVQFKICAGSVLVFNRLFAKFRDLILSPSNQLNSFLLSFLLTAAPLTALQKICLTYIIFCHDTQTVASMLSTNEDCKLGSYYSLQSWFIIEYRFLFWMSWQTMILKQEIFLALQGDEIGTIVVYSQTYHSLLNQECDV